VLAIMAVAGAAVIAGMGVRVKTRAFDATVWGRAMEGRLDQTSAALHARVATLAELPRLAAAVSTDAETVRGLTQEELAFRPRRGESIAIGQLSRHGAPAVLLLAFPDQAQAPPLFPSGLLIRIVGNRLVMSESVKVAPLARADEFDGAVAASSEVDLDDLAKGLAGVGVSAAVTVNGQKLGVGGPDPVIAGRPIDLRLDLQGEGPATPEMHLILSAPAGGATAPYWLGAAGLTLFALLFAVRSRRAANGSARVPAPAPALETSPETLQAPPVALSRPAPALSPAASGRKIGRYEIVQHIGAGGMADVYLARSTGEAGFSKKIALKTLQPAFARQPLVVEHFLDEARLASQLDHPNIVQIIDLGRADDEYFIAMEFVDGADLARLIEIAHRHDRLVPLAVALAILRRICDGLQAAHTARAADGAPLGLVHRDVKCGNVYVARNGVVKIGDFGIAKAHHESQVSRTEIGLVKGTPGYMAPEHRLGQPLDGRADLYGVGAIAYELLAGVPVNLDFVVLAQKGIEGWPHLPPLSRFRNDVSPELQAVVFRALAYGAADRFADCPRSNWPSRRSRNSTPPATGPSRTGSRPPWVSNPPSWCPDLRRGRVIGTASRGR
jgi:tRNA A-37 threonylcarbamoyl transferase component Bud32